jgi:hypothetical protein
MHHLLESVRDPSPREIVWGQFYRYLITRQNPDEMHAHFSGNMRQDFVTIIQLHSEHRIGERFGNRSLHLDDILFRH